MTIYYIKWYRNMNLSQNILLYHIHPSCDGVIQGLTMLTISD